MSVWPLVGAAALLVANAFFVWSEFALIAARRTRVESLAAAGNRRARSALPLMSDLNFVLSGAQLGITMASLGLGFVAEPAVVELLEGPLEGWPHGLATVVEVAVGLGVVVSAHMVLGEMVPKNLAIAEPERSALALAVPFRFYALVFRPVILFLNVLANGVLRVLGETPRDELVPAHSAAEIAFMLGESREHGVIESFQHGLLVRTLSFDRLDARAVMVPRTDVVAVPHTATPAEIEQVVVETGHSRIPVYRDDLDDVLGFVHVKDLFGLRADEADRPVSEEVIRPMLLVPESRSLPDLLGDMQEARRHFAVVVDEHGGVEGVVTLEDVLEELVGDIRDEYDPGEGKIWRIAPRRALADARLRPDELADLVGLALPEGGYDTLAGFVLARLGRMPEVGDTVEEDGWILRVRRMVGHRIDLVELQGPVAGSQPSDASDP